MHKYRYVEGLVLVKVSPDVLAASLDSYLASTDVMYAEPDYKVTVTAPPNDPDMPFRREQVALDASV